MVEVIVSRLGLDSASNSFVVILNEKDGSRILPIWIGRAEAESIAAHLDRVLRPRPMTHDLAQSLIVTLGGHLERVRITHVEQGTYYAELQIKAGGVIHVVDARPSDSIAIALRCDAPLFAAEELLVEYELPPPVDEPAGEDAPSEPDLGFGTRDAQVRSAEQLQAYLEKLRPEDFGKFKL